MQKKNSPRILFNKNIWQISVNIRDWFTRSLIEKPTSLSPLTYRAAGQYIGHLTGGTKTLLYVSGLLLTVMITGLLLVSFTSHWRAVVLTMLLGSLMLILLVRMLSSRLQTQADQCISAIWETEERYLLRQQQGKRELAVARGCCTKLRELQKNLKSPRVMKSTCPLCRCLMTT